MKMPPFGTTLQSLRGRSMRSWAGLTLGGFARRYSADRNAILGRQAVRLKHALVVAGLLLGLVGSAKADVDIAYSGKLTQLPESALFSLIPRNRAIVFQPGRNLFRLWGADISGTKLPVEILDFEYRCRHVGEVLARDFGRAFIVDCRSGGIDLSGLLIRKGLAKEICSETGNDYGTCFQRKDVK